MDFDFLQQGAMLAPMAGVTDMPFRVICHEMGCPMAVSEMVSAKGYLLSPKGNRAAQELLSVDESEKGAVALQLFGHEPDVMARAAEELTADGRYALLDINMGARAEIVGNGEGSALMKEPVRAAELIAAVAKASHVPVTVKMRLGFEAGSEAYLLLGQLAQESGAQMITLHARTRSQFYEGHADWKAIARLKQRVSIPVVGNGDILCWQDALRMREETGCDGVAVGRAAQGNPWILRRFATRCRADQSVSRTMRKSWRYGRAICICLPSSRAKPLPFVKCGGILSAMSAACATRRGFESGSMRLPIWKN